MQWWVPIVVAVIGGPLMWFLAKFDRNNTNQHNNNMKMLERIETKVDHIETKIDKVDGRLDNHIDWHQSTWRMPWSGGHDEWTSKRNTG